MPQTSDAIKAGFLILKNMGLDLKPIAGWEATIQKYAEFETVMDKVAADFPKAKETANNPNIAPGPAFKEFQENQQKALKLKQELKGPVETLEKGRQALYDAIKKIADKKKADPLRAKLQSINTQFNFMLVSVRQTSEDLGPLTPKPQAAPQKPPPAPPTTPANQYAKTPGSVPVPPKPPANQYAKTPGSVKG